MAASLRDQLESMGFEPIDDGPKRGPAVRVEHNNRGDVGFERELTEEDEEIAAKDRVRLVRNGWEFPEDSIVIELE